MMTQSDLFSPADEITGEVVAESETVVADATTGPIAIPCGFRNRHNGPCQRLGNWPVTMDGKQMACRNWPMLHCDPACFKGDPPARIMASPVTTSYGVTKRPSMATFGRSEATFGSHLSENSTLTPYIGVRCPCCASMVEHLPPLWTIEPCRVCRRPLILARAIGRHWLFYLCNLIDIADAIYGVATLGFVLAFVLSEMDARTFMKAVTILYFVVGSLLAVDGLLSCRTGIDRTWNVTRRGVVARLMGVCKIASAALALWLVALGVSL